MSESVFCENCSSKDEFGRGHYVICSKGTCPYESYSLGTGKQFRNATYDFVAPDIASTPVRIHSKRQWKQELKKRGLTDDIKRGEKRVDIKNRPFSRSWDVALDKAIDQSMAESKKKSYSILGKNLSRDQMRQVMRNDYQRRQRRQVA